MVINREETFITHRGRPETDIRLKIGLRKDGRITAVECECIQRGGAHSGYGVVTILYSGSMLYAIYDLHNVKYVGRRVLTNTPPCGAFRGHGTVDVASPSRACSTRWRPSSASIPWRCGAPTCSRAPTFTDNDLMVNSYGLPECVDWVERESGWRERKGKLPAKGKGLGLACSHYISGASKPVNWTGEPHATVKIKLDFRRLDRGALGRRRYRPGLVDHPGADRRRGARASISRACASSPATARWCRRTTAPTRRASPSWSAMPRSTPRSKLKALLVGRGRAQARGAPRGHRMPGRALPRRRAGQGRDLRGGGDRGAQGQRHHHGHRQLLDHPESHGGKKYRGAAIGGTMGYSYSAQVVEVSVDEETGEVTVDKVWVAHDCGKALNRLTVEGQVQGSVWMGMGQAMSEEAAYHDGLLVTANMLDYRVPTIQDSAADRGRHRREQRSAWAVRRQGSGRRLAGRLPAGAHQCHRRCDRHSLQRSAGDARPRVRTAAGAENRENGGGNARPRALRLPDSGRRSLAGPGAG